MIEKFFSLFERLVLAAERLAFGTGSGSTDTAEVVQPAANKPKRGRPAKASAPDSEPEGDGLSDDPPVDNDALGGDDGDDGLGDDEPAEKTPVVAKVTKELMRETMLEYQGLTDGNAARDLLKANTSTKSVAFNTVKEAEYAQVYKATLKAIAAKKKGK